MSNVVVLPTIRVERGPVADARGALVAVFGGLVSDEEIGRFLTELFRRGFSIVPIEEGEHE